MAESNRDEIAKLESMYAANPEGRVFTHLAEAYRYVKQFDPASWRGPTHRVWPWAAKHG